MAVLPILTWPDARLSQVCDPVGKADAAALARDMLDTMYAAEGRGLAAPQVGVLARVFVMDADWKGGEASPEVIVDPEIMEVSDEIAPSDEGCLSIPDLVTTVDRHVWVRMGWTDLDGARQERLLDGFDAICAQHELDHLNGIVTFDRLAPDRRALKEAQYRDLHK